MPLEIMMKTSRNFAISKEILVLSRIMKNFAVFRGIQEISRFIAINGKFRDSAHTAINFVLVRGLHSLDIILALSRASTTLTPVDHWCSQPESNYQPIDKQNKSAALTAEPPPNQFIKLSAYFVFIENFKFITSKWFTAM